MPYTKDNLPDAIKKLPEDLQKTFMAAFNSAYEQYKGDDAKSNATAWAAVKAKYEQDAEGNWKLKESDQDKLDPKVSAKIQAILKMLGEIADILPGPVKTAMDALSKVAYGEPKGDAGYPDIPMKESLTPEDIKSMIEHFGGIDSGLETEASKTPAPAGYAKVSISQLRGIIAELLKELTSLLGKIGYKATATPAEKPKSSIYPYYGYDRQAREEILRKMVMGESVERGMFVDASLVESIEGSDGRRWGVVIIKSGLSRNNHLYEARVLASALPLFEGRKAFIDHPPLDQRSNLPERSVKDIAGWFEGVHQTTSGDLEGIFVVADSQPWLKALLEQQHTEKKDLVGLSIFAAGPVVREEASGKSFLRVQSINRVDSVDVVTEPAAGGGFKRMVESIDAQEEAELVEVKNELQQQAAKSSSKIEEVVDMDPKDLEALENRVKLAESRMSLAESRTIVQEALAASKLPIPIQTRLREDLSGKIVTPEDVTKAITRERDVLAALTGDPESGLKPVVRDVHEPADKVNKAMDGMFSGRMEGGVKPFRSIKEAYAVVTGKSILDINPYTVLGEARNYTSEGRLVESLTSASWAEVLGDSITRALVKEHKLPGLDDWKKLVSNSVPLENFRTQRRIALGGYGTLPTVGEGATYQPLTSPGDDEVTYTMVKKGGLEDLTIETIANDDLGTVKRIPVALARAAKNTLYRYVFTLITDNPTQPDALALFESGTHANLGATALSHATLVTAQTAMLDQTAYGNTTEFLMIKPRYLLVPNELWATAARLGTEDYNPDAIVIAAGGTAVAVQNIRNLFKGALEIIVVPFWTDADNWYLVADPTYMNTIEMGFFHGREEPELMVQDDPTTGSVFTADKISYKIRHIYGGAPIDWRAFYGAVV